MLESALRSRLLEDFEKMPRQIRAAAQWVLDNPRDVALLSMRAQAQRAGVNPASMTRLAQRLGFDGYEGLRDVHAERLRRGEPEFSARAEMLLKHRKRGGDDALAFELAETLERHMAGLCRPDALEAVTKAAAVLAGAGRVDAEHHDRAGDRREVFGAAMHRQSRTAGNVAPGGIFAHRPLLESRP